MLVFVLLFKQHIVIKRIKLDNPIKTHYIHIIHVIHKNVKVWVISHIDEIRQVQFYLYLLKVNIFLETFWGGYNNNVG